MAVLGLRFCARAFSSCGKRGPLFIAVRGPLTIAAALVAEHRLQTHRLSNCGSWAQLLRGMWDLPRPGLKPVSPALAGKFSTTAPPGKPKIITLEDGRVEGRALTPSCESTGITTNCRTIINGKILNSPKKIPHIQRQRRSHNEMVGGAQSQ